MWLRIYGKLWGHYPKISTTDLKANLIGKLYCCMIEHITSNLVNVAKITLCQSNESSHLNCYCDLWVIGMVWFRLKTTDLTQLSFKNQSPKWALEKTSQLWSPGASRFVKCLTKFVQILWLC